MSRTTPWLSALLILAGCSSAISIDQCPGGTCADAASPPDDASVDAGTDAGIPDSGRGDAGSDAGTDAGTDAGRDAGTDAGRPIPRIDFGYYRVDTTPTTGLSYASTVKDWSNVVYVDWYSDARAFDFAPGTDMSAVIANMTGIVSRLDAQGLDVMMDLGYPEAWGARLTKAGILGAMAPWWGRIKYIFLGDELALTLAEANAKLTEFRTAVTNSGLAQRPIGVTLTPATVLSNADIIRANWDFIAIEAYTPSCACGSCGSGTAQAEIDAVVQQTLQQEALIPATTRLVMIMQGYDRNGAFANHATLAELNRATWFQMVKGKSRYQALIIFNWFREGSTCANNPYPGHGHGTSGLPGLQAVHREIWRDLTDGG